MFDTVRSEGALPAGATRDEDWFDPAWLDQAPEPPDTDEPPLSECAPSGWLALELDHSTADPAGLSDAALIDTIIGFDRIASWASARQARLLAEFARRRPGDHPLAARCDIPSRASEFASDEIGLALRLSRTTAINRLVMAEVLIADLPGTLAAWQAGTIDSLKARAIIETSYLLPGELRGALEVRVLPRAGQQTRMDARRADLLTGRRCAAAGDCPGPQCDGDCVGPDCPDQGCPDDSTETTSTGIAPIGIAPAEGTVGGRATPHTESAAAAGSNGHRCGPSRGTPTCGQPAATADLDHTIPYPDGVTSEHNLHASCRHHHRLKTHAPSWDVDQYPDGRITWTTPTGHIHTSHPHDYRPDPHPPPGDDPPPF